MGVGALAVARGKPRALLIGATAALFGLTYVIENLVGYTNGDEVGAILLAAVAGPTALLQIVLAWHLMRELPGNERRRFAWLAAGLAISFGLTHVAFDRAEVLIAWGFNASGAGRASAVALNAQQWGMILIVWAAGARARATRVAREQRSFVALGLAFAFFSIFLHVGTYLALLTPGNDLVADVSNVGIVAVALLTTSSVLALATADPSRGLAERLASPALVLVGLMGLVVVRASPVHEGSFGIVRTIGAALLAVAIVRYGLLDVELPHFARKRGALGAGALAALLIVAQIAQNFFEAKYGLLMGGVVAGAFLFAASPLQRALESRSGDRRVVASQSDERERSFRIAVRMALKDDQITREEERDLVVLADHLGIRPARAYALRDEEERARRQIQERAPRGME